MDREKKKSGMKKHEWLVAANKPWSENANVKMKFMLKRKWKADALYGGSCTQAQRDRKKAFLLNIISGTLAFMEVHKAL